MTRYFGRLSLAIVVVIAAVSSAFSAPSIPVATWYYGVINSYNESAIAPFSFTAAERWHYQDEYNQSSWTKLKGINPSIGVYAYQFGPGTRSDEDPPYAYSYLVSIARWQNARGLSLGDIYDNNNAFILLDSLNNPAMFGANQYYLDIGNPSFVAYWLAATAADIVNQPWKADGIFVDGPWFGTPSVNGSGEPASYPTEAAWNPVAVSFVQGISTGLHLLGQKVFFNAGSASTTDASGYNSWVQLDTTAPPGRPDVMLEEGAFVVGPSGYFAYFKTAAQNAYTLQTMQAVNNVQAVITTGVNGLPGQTRIDNLGNPVSYWDAFYFGISCFLLGKNTTANNSYFNWQDAGSPPQWFSEYNINLGAATGVYTTSNSVYSRQFANGLVVANFSTSIACNLALGGSYRQVTHSNVINPFSAPIITTITLPPCRAAILINPSLAHW